jgi:Concanavalin A-like lectin/glucanases superfamily/Family of unknown function (DUF6519)/Kelch motif
MKGDFSRGIAADPRVSRVLMQQGRVQLDADWNELAAVMENRTRTALADLLGHADPYGPAAVPSTGGGFEVVQLGGLFFDGTTCDEVPDAPSLHHTREFSIEGWINPSASGTIVARYDGAGEAGAFGEFSFAVDERGRLVFTRVLDAGTEPYGVATLVSTIALPFGAYTHVAAIFDGEQLALYAGGVFAGALVLGRGRHDRDVPFLVGARYENGARAGFFNGYIDGLTVWRCGRRHHRHHHHRDTGSAGAAEHARDALLYRLAPAGARTAAGPALAPRSFFVTGGRAYVGGTPCERAACAPLTALAGAEIGTRYLVYLEVWERLVTAAEDPSLLDPALGGIDTSAVVRTEAQVRVAPYAQARQRFANGDARGHAAFAHPAATAIESNQLVRVEVHHAGFPDPSAVTTGDPRIIPATTLANGQLGISVTPDPGWSGGQQLRAVVASSSGLAPGPLLTVQRALGGGAYAVDVALPADARGVVPVADVKWSGDNGSTAFAIASAGENAYTIADPLERGVALAPGDYVELVDDADVCAGRPGVLCSVVGVDTDDPGSVVVTVDGRAPFAGGPGALMRKWDAFDASVAGVEQTSPVAAVQTVKPLALGGGALAAGVEVSFTDGEYRTGDYWWAAMRVNVDGVWGWPLDANGAPLALAPAGVERRYAPLALVTLHGTERASIRDLRAVFAPLTDDDDPLAHDDEQLDTAADGADGAAAHGETERSDRSEEDARDDDAHGRERGEEVLEEGDEFVVRRTHGRHHEPDHHHHHDRHRELPHGALVLTRHERSPEGYRFDGAVVVQRQRDPHWSDDGVQAPARGPAVAAELGGYVYTYIEDTGDLWRYDPRTGDDERRWQRCAPLPEQPRTSPALVALGGRLYVIGGFDARGYPSARCDEFDPGSGDGGAWNPCPRMNVARAAFGAAVVDGHIVVAGGVRRTWLFGWRYASRSVETYVPGDFRWTPRPPLPQRRESCAAMGVGTGVFLVGGVTGPVWVRAGRAGARVDVLFPFEGGWQRRAPLRRARCNARLALVDDALIVVAGATAGGELAPVERYPLCGEGGENVASLELRSPGVAAVGGTVFALAGESSSGSPNATARCEISAPLYVHRREHRDDEHDEPAG